MTKSKPRAREIQRAIAQILLERWDPIGVQDVAAARHEYDFYVGGVYRLLASGATAERIARHLASIEREAMGLIASPEPVLMAVARTLRAQLGTGAT